MRWLITTDNTPRAVQTAQYAAQFIRPGEDEIILAEVKGTASRARTAASQADLDNLFEANHVRRVEIQADLVVSVEKIAHQEQVDIVVYGSRGRRGLTRWLLGSVAARLLHEHPSALLVVREAPRPVHRMLLTTSLGPKSSAVVEIGGLFAARVSAEVTLLHVMSQVLLAENAPTDPLQMTAAEAIAQKTREGAHLAEGLARLAALGVKASPVIRHGLVLDEVVEEIASGGYELVVLGSHGVVQNNHWLQLLTANLADEILMNTRCPLLIV